MGSGAATCSVGHYCLEGYIYELPCEDGFQQANPGQSSCDECGAGRFCYQDDLGSGLEEVITDCVTDNTQCTSEILQRDLKCPKGLKLNAAGDACEDCTDGDYCRGGIAAGPCIAG